MKILIIKQRTIGDVILLTPLLHNIKKSVPNSAIDVLLNKGTEDILNCNSDVSNLIVYRKKHVNRFSKIVSEIRLFFDIYKKKYDVVIDLDKGDRGMLVSKFSGAKIRIGSPGVEKNIFSNTYTDILPKHERRHTVDINLDPLNILKIPIRNKKVSVCWNKNDERIVNKYINGVDKFIHIHPFSRVENKEIDLKTLSKIVDFCEIDLGIKTVLTAAPIKRELKNIKNLISMCKSSPINLSGHLSIRQTSVLNSKARFFIGVDTAIMHIAAANNVPILVFFGPTTPDIWGPWSNKTESAKFNNKGGVQKVGDSVVFSEIRDCLPCNNKGCENGNSSQCLVDLDFEIIKKQIMRLL